MSEPGGPERRPPPLPEAPRGRMVSIGSPVVALVLLLVLAGVVAAGYFGVVRPLGVPWYLALPLSVLAGIMLVVWNLGSTRTWLIMTLLFGAAVLAGAVGYVLWRTA